MMYNGKKIVAIITARGGSKRLPRKNLRRLCGKPLIAWTIDQALPSRYIDDVFVSTEDAGIAAVSKRCGARVIKRPHALARDRSTSAAVVSHAIGALSKTGVSRTDGLILLQPTSPLRSTRDIDNAIRMLYSSECDSVVGVTKSDVFWHMIEKNDYLRPIAGWKYLEQRKQDLPSSYVVNGALYAASFETFKKYRSFFTGRTLPYVMTQESSIDIDTETDFLLAQHLMKNRMRRS